MIQYTVDQLLDQITLYDLTSSEIQSGKILEQVVQEFTRRQIVAETI